MPTTAVVELAAKDLNQQGGVYCPSPNADMQLWNNHPKVYITAKASARTAERSISSRRVRFLPVGIEHLKQQNNCLKQLFFYMDCYESRFFFN